MHFVDECEFRVEAGKGGDGCIAFRREKFMPMGGPAGGDGGRGGDVVLIADEGLGTLADLSHQKAYRAPAGEPGAGRDRYGKAGKHLEIRVPPGTIVHEAATGRCIGELLGAGARLLVAKGGRGGRGNKHFTTPTERAPRKAEPGEPGETYDLRLELRVMADVGLLGLPNVGKSTFITTVTRAQSKVADYPFTTLEPRLGVVRMGDFRDGLGKSFVIADIPGLVPGAAEGRGIGSRFLRHVRRTRVLLHLVTLPTTLDEDPLSNYRALREELRRFDPELAARPELVVLTKFDLPEVRAAYEELEERFAREHGKELYALSSATRHGIPELLLGVLAALEAARGSDEVVSPPA
jgi:GTP-binding protein